ncbi:hypothetical protein RYX36_033517 [Vicia faba]
MAAFNFDRLRDFVFEKFKERYSDLLRKFYANLTYTNGIITSEVKKNTITISLEDFATVCNLPHIEQDYDKKFEGNELDFDTLDHSFLTDPTTYVPHPFNVRVIHLNIRLIHYTVCRIFFQEKVTAVPSQRHIYLFSGYFTTKFPKIGQM